MRAFFRVCSALLERKSRAGIRIRRTLGLLVIFRIRSPPKILNFLLISFSDPQPRIAVPPQQRLISQTSPRQTLPSILHQPHQGSRLRSLWLLPRPLSSPTPTPARLAIHPLHRRYQCRSQSPSGHHLHAFVTVICCAIDFDCFCAARSRSLSRLTSSRLYPAL